jgi:YgiT-type zinc finger domain-containing protein
MKTRTMTCPLCGTKTLTSIRGDIHLNVGSKTADVPNVRHYECGSCGEQFFDYEASKQIDEHVLDRRHRASKPRHSSVKAAS